MLRGAWQARAAKQAKLQAEVNAKKALEAQERAREDAKAKAEEDAKRRTKEVWVLMSAELCESPRRQRVERRVRNFTRSLGQKELKA